MNKKIVNLLLVLLICLCIPISVSATTHDVYVYDYADLLTETEEQRLYDLGKKYLNTLDLDIVFLTYDDANGKSTMVYTDDFYDGIEGDYCHADDGILFAIDMDNREIYINTVGLAIRELSDSEIDRFLDYGYDEIVDEEYYECLRIMADKALYNIQSDITEQENPDAEKATITDKMLENIFISIGMGVVVLVILVLKHYAANKKTLAVKYLDNNTFRVNKRNTVLVDTKTDIRRDYYKKSSSSSSSRSSGSSHRSSSGRSHGGGGRRF